MQLHAGKPLIKLTRPEYVEYRTWVLDQIEQVGGIPEEVPYKYDDMDDDAEYLDIGLAMITSDPPFKIGELHPQLLPSKQ